MSTSTINIVVGNAAQTFSLAAYPANHLKSYSTIADAKLKVLATNSSSDRSDDGDVDAIVFETCEDIAPVAKGFQTVLLWILKHPAMGYPASYKGHKQLTIELAQQISGGPIPFIGLLRVYEAQLLLGLKDHLGRQFAIRKAIVNYITTTRLTPNELFKVGQIFSYPASADEKLVNYAVNMTMDFMDADLGNGSLDKAGFDALDQTFDRVPMLSKKLVACREGKRVRLEREQAKANRDAQWQAMSATRNRQRAYQASVQRNSQYQKVNQLEELQKATDGYRTIPMNLACQLMTGPVVYKGELAKEV